MRTLFGSGALRLGQQTVYWKKLRCSGVPKRNHDTVSELPLKKSGFADNQLHLTKYILNTGHNMLQSYIQHTVRFKRRMNSSTVIV
jgi:hypothetical protein